MSRSAAALAHERAGRAQLETLGLRVSEPNAPDAPDTTSAPPRVDRPFAIGSTAFDGFALECDVESEGPVALVHLRVRNVGDRTRRLDAVTIGLRWSDHGLASLRTLRHGWQSWSATGAHALDEAGTEPFPSGPWLRGFHHALPEAPADRAGWHESHLVTVVGGRDGEPALLAGAYERGVSFALVYARPDGDAVRLAIELACETELAAGESVVLETLRVALGDDPSRLLEAFALDYGRRNGARVARPFVAGWCSWYWAFQHVSEEDLLRNLEALAAAREELPVDVVQLDDGYQRAVGDWRATNARFPRGLAPLAEEIRAAGFVPGLWTAPFCVVPESELFARHPDWLLQQGGAPFRAMVHPDWSRDATVHALDPSHPEVAAHLESLFADFVGLGFRYLKLDFLFVAALRAEARSGSRAARLRAGLESIRAGAGEEAFLLGCGSPLGAAVGVVDGMRIGPDVAPHWHPDPKRAIPGIEETLPSTRVAIRSVLGRAWMHRRLWLNDPDCLMVRSQGTELTTREREALAVAIAGTGGSCVVSDDLATLGADDRALLGRALSLAAAVDGVGIPGGARVADLLVGDVPDRVVTTDGETRLEALVNAGEQTRSFALPEGVETRIGPPAAVELSLPPRSGALVASQRPVELAVFCDFDGTFSVQDVGATLAVRYGGDRRPDEWARYERGECTPWDYNLAILDGMAVDAEATDAFLRTVDLDPGARDLLAWCEERGVPFRILSDGFDWNLNRLQVIHRVAFSYRANRLWIEDGRWRIRAGHPNPDCGCGTGTCKAGLIAAYRAAHPGAVCVHIGNGRVSDSCGAVEADAAFAKDSLATALERRGEPFTRFETLHDVIPALEALRPGPAPKPLRP